MDFTCGLERPSPLVTPQNTDRDNSCKTQHLHAFACLLKRDCWSCTWICSWHQEPDIEVVNCHARCLSAGVGSDSSCCEAEKISSWAFLVLSYVFYFYWSFWHVTVCCQEKPTWKHERMLDVKLRCHGSLDFTNRYQKKYWYPVARAVSSSINRWAQSLKGHFFRWTVPGTLCESQFRYSSFGKLLSLHISSYQKQWVKHDVFMFVPAFSLKPFPSCSLSPKSAAFAVCHDSLLSIVELCVGQQCHVLRLFRRCKLGRDIYLWTGFREGRNEKVMPLNFAAADVHWMWAAAKT